ncbi:MAG: DUF371 domain-containing protein [Infirmifilum sp.]|uniref:DUF371 domain-containing protein n=1 Tax=Infirmifilum TaxID=2856573 RepID=UPI001F484D31|nr:DUF371 domain-containing protein [Infirmifilum uzonense]
MVEHDLGVIDEIVARGHPNIKASHRTTLEITKDAWLTPRGDCIIAVSSNKSASDLNPQLKKALKDGLWLVFIISALKINEYDYLVARGSPSLLFTDSRSLVIRKSSYIDGRTIAINSNKAAKDIHLKIREYLKSPDATIRVLLIATNSPDAVLAKLEDFIRKGGPGGT